MTPDLVSKAAVREIVNGLMVLDRNGCVTDFLPLLDALPVTPALTEAEALARLTPEVLWIFGAPTALTTLVAALFPKESKS